MILNNLDDSLKCILELTLDNLLLILRNHWLHNAFQNDSLHDKKRLIHQSIFVIKYVSNNVFTVDLSNPIFFRCNLVSLMEHSLYSISTCNAFENAFAIPYPFYSIYRFY